MLCHVTKLRARTKVIEFVPELSLEFDIVLGNNECLAHSSSMLVCLAPASRGEAAPQHMERDHKR